jgi:predicted nucleic acid-binding protein
VTYVVDACVVVEYLLGKPLRPGVSRVLRHGAGEAHVPALCDVEVTSALRRLLRSAEIEADRSSMALDDYLDLPLTRHPHERLLHRILALRANLTAYDATYVALAEALGATLVTRWRARRDGTGGLHDRGARHPDVSIHARRPPCPRNPYPRLTPSSQMPNTVTSMRVIVLLGSAFAIAVLVAPH